MKRYIKNTLAALSIVALASSCGDFGDLNVDPEHSNSGNVNYQMVFTNAQHQALGSDWDVWRDGLIYLSQWNQHISAGGWWWSYGLNSYSNGYAAAYWGSVLGSGDRAAIRDIQTVISKWKDDPANQQNYQIARIIRAYTFQRLTDLHGDIPYSEAGQPAEYPYPKYDTQKDIYMDLLKELDEAQAALGSGVASLGKQELFYNGDVAKLKKFANSLMLRVAMRLTKVDDATAKTYAAKAFANGVITSNDDNCMLMHAGGVTTNDSSEPYAKIIVHEDPGVAFINTTFLDLLKSTNDPRIPLFMCVYPTDYETKDVDPAKAENAAPALQKALPGDEHGKGGVLNLVTKRGDLRGVNSKLSWTQVETGSAITWKYPSCILRGDGSQAEFYSVAVTNNYQEADTGTKMIHMGKNTKSTIISKGISAGHSQNSYRGLVRATSNADNARNYSSCDSLLLGSDCGAHTFPYMDIHNDSAVVEHEATTSKISEDQLFYCNQRGIPTEQAVGLIVNGYAKEVLNKLPMEFAVEAQKLLSVSLEGTVG